MSIDLDSVKKILIIQYQPFGDVLLNTGYLPVLRRKFPDAQIDFLVRKPYDIIMKNNPHIDETITFRNGQGISYFIERLKLIKRIRTKKYDVVIDQIRNTGSAQITLFSGARYRLGFTDKRWKSLYNYGVPRKNVRYYSALKFDVLEPLGIKEEPHELFYYIEDESMVYVNKWLKQENLKPGQFVCFSPGSPVKTKQWNLKNYAGLGDRIVSELQMPLVVLWAPKELKDAQNVQSLMKEKSILAPSTTFNQAAAMLKNCTLLICNDGGLNHLSVATGTPSIALFGKHGPRRWSPVIFENHFHFHKKNNNYRNDNTFGITVDEVFVTARNVLLKTAGGKAESDE